MTVEKFAQIRDVKLDLDRLEAIEKAIKEFRIARNSQNWTALLRKIMVMDKAYQDSESITTVDAIAEAFQGVITQMVEQRRKDFAKL